MPNPYVGTSQILELAEELRGDENVYLGVRPFGFHAGNMVSLVAYPIMLCRAMVDLGKVPKFSFHLFLNDYEQYEIDGPAPKTYRYNIYPHDTTIQFAKVGTSEASITDTWAPIIIDSVSEIVRRFPTTTLTTTLTSQMKDLPVFRFVLLETLRKPNLISEAIRNSTGKEVLEEAVFALPLHPVSHHAVHDYIVHEDSSISLFDDRGEIGRFAYEDLEYWFHHKPMAIPRIQAFNIDLCITGIDHAQEGDLAIREALVETFGFSENVKPFKTLYAPTLLSRDGQKMSKSRGNTATVQLDRLLDALTRNPDLLQIPFAGRTQERSSAGMDF